MAEEEILSYARDAKSLLVPRLLGCPDCDMQDMDQLRIMSTTSPKARCRKCGRVYDIHDTFMERWYSDGIDNTDPSPKV